MASDVDQDNVPTTELISFDSQQVISPTIEKQHGDIYTSESDGDSDEEVQKYIFKDGFFREIVPST